MTAESNLDLLAQNLAETYVAIAKGVVGTEEISGSGFHGVVNSFPHPICNFALCSDTEQIDADTLHRVGGARRHFNVYVCHRQDESRAGPALEKAGFAKRYVLSQMWSAEVASGPQIELRVARVMGERVRLAKFMACQFFSSQPGHVQGKIARASAQPAGLKLYEAVSVEVRRGPLGAVMLHSTDGVVGLYNLCIGIPYRSRGFGGGIIRAVQAIAAHEGAQVGLQCDSQLESWYSRFGMERAGFVSVFGLDRR